MSLKMFDGAMGTMLQSAGVADKPCPEYANIISPEIVTAIHRQYVNAGSNIIETNTFGANPIKLEHFGLTEQTEEINLAAVTAARKAANSTTKVAGSVGPTGRLIKPLGDLDFDDAFACYARQIKALANAKVDYILIETIIDIQEMRAAVLAAKSVCTIPIICQLSFEDNARTVTGTDAKTAAIILEALGASIIGMNCSLGPAELLPIVQDIATVTSLPISVQANAGLPTLQDGKTVFPLSPEEMAAYVPQLINAGASIIGGCCGTTPAHIKAMAEMLANCQMADRPKLPNGVALTSRTRSIYLGKDYPTNLIGERINPTGRKVMAEEIRQNKLNMVKRDALNQVAAGATLLDVNMGVPGIDQIAIMHKAVSELSMLVDVPLVIDSTEPDVIEIGLKHFPGRALINSVSDNPKTKDIILKLAKKYGAAVILLPLTEKSLPKTAEERIEIIKRLVQDAKSHGLNDNDFVLDALVLTVATDGDAPQEIMKTLQLYRQIFGYPTTMGLSNISFGLPNREMINKAFYITALANGLDAPIINPLTNGIDELTKAYQVISAKDKQGIDYSKHYANKAKDVPPGNVIIEQAQDVLSNLCRAVMQGEKELASQLSKQALDEGHKVVDIANNALSKAMNKIGESFALGKAFLPQIMLAAEAMRDSFTTLKENLTVGETIEPIGKVVLATVAGDIHDLGKNIVAALLSNSGFTVIDLGKDVDPSTILLAVQKENPDFVGLCALMTTTLPAMEESINLLRQNNLPTKIMVGGAVLTADYARKIHADFYAKNGVEAVRIAKNELLK